MPFIYNFVYLLTLITGQLPPCVSGQDIPTTGTPDLSGSSQADSIDLPLDVSDQHVPTMSAPGLHSLYMFVYVY